MRTDLKISFHLDHFYYHNENYEWTNEMPRFWFCFFKIDGTTCKLNESLQLEGNAVIYSSFEKMESLNNIEPDKHDVIRLPVGLGREEINLKPIPVPEFVKKTGMEDIEAQVGCIVVLMNESCATNDENNCYSKILTATIQDSLNEWIPWLSHDKNNSYKYFDGLKYDIKSKILQESRKNQSFWKRLTTENIVNTTIWKFSSDELRTMHSVSLTQYWGTEGLWELSGELKIQKAELPVRTASEGKSRRKQSIGMH